MLFQSYSYTKENNPMTGLNTYFDIENLSSDMLNYIAYHQAGRIFSSRPVQIRDRHGYRFQCIQTNKDNYIIFMVGMTEKTRRLINDGKKKYLVEKFGINENLAERICAAQKNIQYSREDQVVEYLLSTRNKIQAWLSFPEREKDLARWQRAWKMPSTNLHFNKLKAVCEMAKQVFFLN